MSTAYPASFSHLQRVFQSRKSSHSPLPGPRKGYPSLQPNDLPRCDPDATHFPNPIAAGLSVTSEPQQEGAVMAAMRDMVGMSYDVAMGSWHDGQDHPTTLGFATARFSAPKSLHTSFPDPRKRPPALQHNDLARCDPDAPSQEEGLHLCNPTTYRGATPTPPCYVANTSWSRTTPMSRPVSRGQVRRLNEV